jgi:hypothetical protein
MRVDDLVPGTIFVFVDLKRFGPMLAVAVVPGINDGLMVTELTRDGVEVRHWSVYVIEALVVKLA